ncbi:MAG TPA: VirB3 family type IV secretion system protein [Thermoanaerobaculia bacterium]|nr:VirB3 family type IV secretion system protein [Thermoanaerobaculia bacterium]
MPTPIQKTPIHASLCRPVLYAGVAPGFLFFELSAVFLLLFEAGIHLATLGLALAYGLCFHPLAVHVCGKDPQIAELYIRSLRNADYYAAAPALRAPVPAVDPALAGSA